MASPARRSTSSCRTAASRPSTTALATSARTSSSWPSPAPAARSATVRRTSSKSTRSAASRRRAPAAASSSTTPTPICRWRWSTQAEEPSDLRSAARRHPQRGGRSSACPTSSAARSTFGSGAAGNTLGTSAANRLEIDGTVLQIFNTGANNNYFLVDTAGGLQVNDSTTGGGGASVFDLLVHNGNLTGGGTAMATCGPTSSSSKSPARAARSAPVPRAPLEINANNSATATSAGGNIFLRDTQTAFPLGLINAGGGNVDLPHQRRRDHRRATVRQQHHRRQSRRCEPQRHRQRRMPWKRQVSALSAATPTTRATFRSPTASADF